MTEREDDLCPVLSCKLKLGKNLHTPFKLPKCRV
jgi:hypothetical protein